MDRVPLKLSINSCDNIGSAVFSYNLTKMLLLMFILLVLIISTGQCFNIIYGYKNENFIISQIKENLPINTNDYLVNSTWCLAYIEETSLATQEILDIFLKFNDCPTYIFNTTEKITSRIPDSIITYIFVDDIREITERTELLLSNTYWNAQCAKYVIVCKQVKTKKGVAEIFRFLWKKYQLFYTVVLIRNKLDFITYNPFLNKVVHTKNCEKCRGFEYYAKNMFGYKINVHIHEMKPVTYKANGVWRGSDHAFIKNFVEHFNASIVYMAHLEHNRTHGLEANEHKNFDIDANSVFAINLTSNPLIDYSQSIRTDDIVALVPKSVAKPSFERLFSAFNYPCPIWLCFLLTALTFRLIYWYAGRNMSFIECALEIVRITYQNPVNNIQSKPTLFKFMAIIYISGALILCTMSQSSLMTILISEKYFNDLDTINDLNKSNLEIYTSPGVLRVLPKSFYFERRMHVREYSIISQMIFNKTPNCAFLLRRFFATSILRTVNNANKTVYHMLSEGFLPSHDVLGLKKRSIYLRLVNDFINFKREFRLRPTMHQTSSSIIPFNKKKYIDKEHLLGLFYWTSINFGICTMVFLLELYTGHLHPIVSARLKKFCRKSRK